MLEIPSLRSPLHHINNVYTDGANRGIKGRRAWTDYVARRLAEQCPTGCTVYGRQWADKGGGEYFVDQVWGIGDDTFAWQEYQGLVLAMECKWLTGRDRLFEDFCKSYSGSCPAMLIAVGVKETRAADKPQSQ